MNEATLKLPTWQPQAPPDEDRDMKAHRQMINEIVYSLHHRKKEILSQMDMPPQPVTLREIWKEYESRVEQLKQMRLWKHKKHTKRWLDRRVNECATPKFYNNKIPKIIAVTAGKYAPNFNEQAGDLT